jgi:hypothetical protein
MRDGLNGSQENGVMHCRWWILNHSHAPKESPQRLTDWVILTALNQKRTWSIRHGPLMTSLSKDKKSASDHSTGIGFANHDLSPFEVVRAGIAAVPAVRYALGIAGIMAALALGKAFFSTAKAAILASLVMLCLMTLLLIFSTATRVGPTFLRVPALVLTWAVLILFVASSVLTVSSVFFGWPQRFPILVRTILNPTGDGQPEGKKKGPQPLNLKSDDGSALLINDFYDHRGRLFPGNYHVLVSAPTVSEAGIPVLQSGANLNTTLVCKCQPGHSIVITRLDMNVAYSEKSNPRYKYDSSSSNFNGKELIQTLSYLVRLNGNSIFVARAGESTRQGSTGLSPRSLLMDGQAISLNAESPPQPLVFHIGAIRNGSYEIQLVSIWSSGGSNRETRSQPVFLYRDE